MIKVVRIDHRLLHGQVVFAWTKSQNIDRIIVIDNKSSTDDFKKMSLKLSKPADVKLNVFSVAKALEKLDQIKALPDNIMVIFGNVSEMYEFVTAHGDIKEVNYGGIPDRPGAKRYTNAIFLTDEEVALSKQLAEKGIQLVMQQVPTSRKELLNEKI
ncbi:PTS sugar transporter subunit IIB [Enterococcus cecorum]|nr:PTS sugar transporter subunit IIB [Enterococcus cecorum]CAI3332755.1 PTS sugar transporter subunit IIB [Enterococcus cecorum]CAI3372259.1 PTS sugar transporter subunit IIB [Enterococcus cecorum]